jgi:hypothetical protein
MTEPRAAVQTWRDRSVPQGGFAETPGGAATGRVKQSWRDQSVAASEPEPSLGEKATAITQGAVGGAAQTAPIIGGLMAGAKGGAMVGAVAGPAGVVPGAVVGGLTGAVGGFFVGQGLQSAATKVKLPWGDGEPLAFENIASVPKNLRPYVVAGETFGGSVAAMGAPYVLAANGVKFAPNLVGRFVNSIIETASRSPVSFAAAEISAATGASIGAGVMESQFPGSGAARLSGEVVGGVLNPAKLTISLGRMGYDRFKNIASNFSEVARTNKAAQVIQEIVRDAGDDPVRVADLIARRSAEFPNLNLTSAQLTSSPGLQVIESTIAKSSAEFGSKSQEMAVESLKSIRTMISALDSVGTPDALRVAAKMRQDYFDTLISTRLQVAEQNALRAAANIDLSKPGSAAEFGRQASQIMDEAMSQVRTVERELWGKIDRTLPGTSQNIQQIANELRTGSMLPEETFPPLVEGFLKRTAEAPTSTGELLIFRSRMLEEARKAASQGDGFNARIYGQMAEGALEDLSQVSGAGMDAINAARNYSRQLNETFGGTFAGRTLGVTDQGQRRIPPELMMVRAFGAGKEAGELQLRQLEDAAKLAGQEYLTRIMDVQEQTIRMAASQTIDADGRVIPDRLNRFLRNNKDLLDRFPEVRDNLKTAESAQRFLRATQEGADVASKRINQESAFARILRGEDPALAIRGALNSTNPSQDFGKIAQLASRSGQEAKDGMKSSIFSMLYQEAGGDAGFSFARYRDLFEGPLSKVKGKPDVTLKNLMLRNGLLSEKEHNTLVQFMRRAAEIEDVMSARIAPSEALQSQDAIADFMTRITGARMASLIPGQGGSPLIIAGAGSQLARQVLDKVPNAKIKNLIQEASLNPQMMEMLLRKQVTQQDKIKFAMQMNAFLWQAGINAAIDEE